MSAATAGTVAELRDAVGAVPDPEVPVITLADLGVLRDVRDEGGRLVVEITPTYSGCPAIEAIGADVRRVCAAHGHPEAEVRVVLAPAWSTDEITAAGRRKLAEYGMAPPAPRAAAGPVAVDLTVRCPRCGSTDTRLLSRFSATPCTALRVCAHCAEPFDHFKEL